MSDLLHWPPSWSTLLLLPALFMGFTVHELAHALMAYLLGDTSQVERNRLTFNPLRHVSWVGMGAFLLFGFGWAKPVWFDHTRFHLKNRPFGTFLVAVSGSAANLTMAMLAMGGIFLTLLLVAYFQGMSAVEDAYLYLVNPTPGPDLRGLAVALSSYMVMVNLLLGIFNLIPLPLFDGFQAMVSLFLAIQLELRRPRRPAVASAAPVVPVAPAAAVSVAAAPTSPAQIHFDIGLAYQREGQWDEAIARYRQATDQDSGFGLAYYNLGLAYWAKGRLPLAQSAFRAAATSSDEPAVRKKAGEQFQVLARAAQNPDWTPAPVPPPLESLAAVRAELGTETQPQVDAAVARGVWLRLAAGAAAGLTLALGAWVFVTAVTMLAVG